MYWARNSLIHRSSTQGSSSSGYLNRLRLGNYQAIPPHPRASIDPNATATAHRDGLDTYSPIYTYPLHNTVIPSPMGSFARISSARQIMLGKSNIVGYRN